MSTKFPQCYQNDVYCFSSVLTRVPARFLLALPFALPQLYHQYLAVVWLLVYLGATYAYEQVCLGLQILNISS